MGVAVVVSAACATPAHAEERPKWELGVGGVFYTQPYYVGSDDYRFVALPFPWFIYRGTTLRLDRESVQAKVFGSDYVRIDVSGAGQISVNSNDVARRRGMPDLDWIAQLGPTARFPVRESDDGRHVLEVDVPLRVALAISSSNFTYEGFVASPKLQYRYEPDNWRFEANAGLEFSSNSYNEYVYGVPARYATADRSAYGADGGYAGVRLSGGVSRYFGNFYVGLFARYINLEGATFGDSPLVASRSAVIGGVAIGWIWMKSEEMVPVGAQANRLRRKTVASPDAQVAPPEADASSDAGTPERATDAAPSAEVPDRSAPISPTPPGKIAVPR